MTPSLTISKTWREFGSSAKVTLHLSTGRKLTDQIGHDHTPKTWGAGEVIICESHRNGSTSIHSVREDSIIAVTVTV